MTNDNAAMANDTPMPKNHRDYMFGTFEERLAHLCALFETDPPEIVYEDGEAVLTETLAEWLRFYRINLDWLFAGSPCGMLRLWADSRTSEREMAETLSGLEPPVRNGLLALLRAVIDHNLPMDESLAVFSEAVREFRAGVENNNDTLLSFA